MYPGFFGESKPEDENYLKERLETQVGDGEKELSDFLYDAVETEGYGIKQVLNLIADSNLYEFDPENYHRRSLILEEDEVSEPGSSRPGEPIDTEEVDSKDLPNHLCVERGEYIDRYHHRMIVPENEFVMRSDLSRQLNDFISMINFESEILQEVENSDNFTTRFENHFKAEYGEEQLSKACFALKNWFTEDYSKIDSWEESEAVSNYVEITRRVFGDVFNEESIPVFRGITIEGAMNNNRNTDFDSYAEEDLLEVKEFEREIRDKGLEVERNTPDSWSRNPQVAMDFTEARNSHYNRGVLLRKTVDADDLLVCWSSELSNELILDDDQERFTGEEIRIVDSPEANFSDHDLRWLYDNLHA